MNLSNLFGNFHINPGLVLFLEEDHYVAEDFLHLLALMQKRANELCAKCNILSLGTYLKTFNYYTYANVNKVNCHAFFTTLNWFRCKVLATYFSFINYAVSISILWNETLQKIWHKHINKSRWHICILREIEEPKRNYVRNSIGHHLLGREECVSFHSM